MKNKLKVVKKVFEDKHIRTIWDRDEEKYYISIVDIVGVLMYSNYQNVRNN